MSKILSYLFILIIIVLSIFFANCGAGTDTGNPTTENAEFPATGGIFDGEVDPSSEADDGAGSPPADIEDPETVTLLTAICDAVAACFDNFSTILCRQELNTDTNALAAFGADSSFDSFDAVQDAIDSGDLSVSSSEFSTCVNAIEAVSCQDMENDGVFDESDPMDFSDVFRMIPEEC